jgi:hypothetical protein
MKTLAVVLVVVLASGCAETPHYDARFGDAVRKAKVAMTINPDAGKAGDEAKGMDGPSAKEAMTRYQGTFKEPPPATNVINIGGTIGSASGSGNK